MPEDIAYNQNRNTEWDSVGDIRTVNGEDELLKSAATALIERADLSAPSLTPTAVESQKADIVETLRRHPRLSGPINVTVVEVDEAEQTITYGITTASLSLSVNAN